MEPYARGWAELMAAVRAGESWSGYERNGVFLNAPDGARRFIDISGVSGLDFPDDARAIAFCDWDCDGDVDLWLRNRTAPRLRLMLNRGGGGGGLVFELEGTRCNRDAVGAVVELGIAGQAPMRRTIRAGELFLSQSSRRAHFGIGSASTVESVSVRWPGGVRERFVGVAAPGRFLLREGLGRALPAAHPAPVEIPESGPLPTAAGGVAGRVWFPAALPIPPIVYRDRAAQRAIVRPDGKAQLLLLWSAGCGRCRAELESLQRDRATLGQAGITLLALSVDGIDGAGMAYALTEQLGFDGPWGFAEAGWLEALWRWAGASFDRTPAPGVPLALLLDRRGQAVALYRGAVAAAQVAEDAEALLGVDPLTRWHLAPALRGTWFTNPVPAAFVHQTLGVRERYSNTP